MIRISAVVALVCAALVFIGGAPAFAAIALAADVSVPAVVPMAAWAWLVAHAAVIGAILAGWAVAASFVNRVLWPKPQPSAPAWKRWLHWFWIDVPSFLAARGWAGQLGPFTGPFMTTSKALGATGAQ